ncbi:nitrogen fixation negative regulator NifL [Methylococcus sp. EFPC2]|uniref:nitrogen fixation negative regulator NifL n=1 Tax=Methylococcus sp. EFPC2 TaxID=2812648 RepID=UPI0019670B72|nr:nitrogen fixation negative regulator NifL [Methylococcus sp. EFPC2]QSA96188.1 nitrogen fixation negative regulator NifL [Methylococcus sp. EFPC2]
MPQIPEQPQDTLATEEGPSPSEPALSAELLAEAVRQAPVAISITDAHANIIYVNPSFTETTGYAPEQSIGRNESMLSDKRTPKQVYEELWGRLQAQQPWHGCLVNRHRDGGRYLADLTIAPILDKNQRTTHYIGMHRDITEVFRLEQQVLNQKVLIETVVDSMPVATLLLDEAKNVLLDNRMYKALVSDLRLEQPTRLIIDALRKDMGEEWNKLKHSGLTFRNRELRIDLGGSRMPKWYACSGAWFSRGDDSVDGFFEEKRQTYLLLILNDVTQQKKHEEEMRINAMRALMSEEERIQSLRETLSAAIHHIQAPLNLLTAAKTLLARRGQDQSNQALNDILEQILSSGENSVRRLKNCLPDVDAARMTPVNLNQLLHETIILLTDRLLASGIVVDWKPSPVLPSLTGMEHRLRTLFKQIIENAIDAMNQGGCVIRELRIATWSDDQLVHVRFEDTGPGIPDDLRTKVFEPFFSTKTGGARPHTGMGLALAQEVINQHQGLIRIDPGYRDGCRIDVQFNLRSAHAKRPYAHG